MIENKKSKRQAIEEKFEEYFSQRVSEKWDGERWVNGTTLKKEWIIKHVCNLSPDSPEQYFQKYNTDSVRTSLTKEGKQAIENNEWHYFDLPVKIIIDTDIQTLRILTPYQCHFSHNSSCSDKNRGFYGRIEYKMLMEIKNENRDPLKK